LTKGVTGSGRLGTLSKARSGVLSILPLPPPSPPPPLRSSTPRLVPSIVEKGLLFAFVHPLSDDVGREGEVVRGGG
jgi:hypothetical protein